MLRRLRAQGLNIMQSLFIYLCSSDMTALAVLESSPVVGSSRNKTFGFINQLHSDVSSFTLATRHTASEFSTNLNTVSSTYLINIFKQNRTANNYANVHLIESLVGLPVTSAILELSLVNKREKHKIKQDSQMC